MAESEQFGMMNALASGFAAFLRNLGTIAALAAVLFALPVLFWSSGYRVGNEIVRESGSDTLWLFADFFFSLGVIVCVVRGFDRQPVKFLSVLRMASARLVSAIFASALLLGLMIIVALFVGGIFLLIARAIPLDREQFVGWLAAVPMLIVLPFFLVSIPAIIMESIGPVVSLRRSFELTEGYRWTMVGMLILLVFVEVATDNVADLLSEDSVLIVLMDVAFSAFCASILAVSYHRLRELKEGGRLERELS